MSATGVSPSSLAYLQSTARRQSSKRSSKAPTQGRPFQAGAEIARIESEQVDGRLKGRELLRSAS
eukprot:6002480-Pleurochrysis_carterae.AAC.1